ncbi:BnaAnng13530D [Brassica napus]|uniref:BnaAnng13530D protein n=2 Tax=Brassica TaxID=3705 RepID=A0A078IX99_BRANA|nr:BnaAnng13530D [Brassica napus]VDD48730.1 unnamed protein product [Brassica oleracea]
MILRKENTTNLNKLGNFGRGKCMKRRDKCLVFYSSFSVTQETSCIA